MPWTYEQSTGKLLDPDGNVVGIGYSGAGDSKNQPDAQNLADKGPIPCGEYTIGKPVDTVTHGPYVMPLTPAKSNTMFGRSGFLCHGDSVISPGTASEGCIIQSRDVRNQLGASKDRKLVVVSGIQADTPQQTPPASESAEEA
jgi:hypothetical protein